MAKDPAFLFYPGDYLRDTQLLSEKAQVSYDRIMCEHMRNICIRQQQVNFLTKQLDDVEKEMLLTLLDKVDGGYQIPWVAESIMKRRNYGDSRRKNRTSKSNKICKTYDSHMENENENEIIIKDKERKSTVFKRPTLEEVKLFINNRKSCVDAEKFFYHYETTGWMSGRNKIKDWKSCVYTWERSDMDNKQRKDNCIIVR